MTKILTGCVLCAAGLIVLIGLGAHLRREQRNERQQQKEKVMTWEDEGGALRG